jgi:tol-pal system protein YbgF
MSIDFTGTHRSGRGVGLLAAALLLGALAGGCASQADLIDTRLMLDKVAAGQKKLDQQMVSIEGKLDHRPADVSTAGASAQLTTQYDQLQGELQTLKGQVEETGHAIAEFRQRMDDESFKLSALTAQIQTLQSSMAGVAPPTSGAAPESAPAGSDKMVLPGRTPAAKPGTVTPVEAYNLAYNDYLRGHFSLATSGFEQFLQQYPTSMLVPHALYWLGESYYNSQQYPKAVEVFDQLIQRFPKHEKVPAAMLKNGLAYLEIGDKLQASQQLKRLVANYPASDEALVAKGRLAEIR